MPRYLHNDKIQSPQFKGKTIVIKTEAFYFSPVEEVRGTRTHKMRGGSLYSHTTSGPTTRLTIPISTPPPTPSGVQGPLKLDVSKVRHYWHSTMANAPKDGEDNFSGSTSPGASAASPKEGMRKLWLSRKAVGKNQGYPSWTLQGRNCGLKESRRLSSPCCSLLPPRPLLLRLELSESWPGSPLHF